jgi:predicted alpha/beta hydrolase
MNVERNMIRFDATDGVTLAGDWFLPTPKARVAAVTVVACGGGIPARLYRRMAQYLAGQGIAVLTFDYRGIGKSRSTSLRGFDAGLDQWGRLDFGAALALASRTYPDVRLAVVAHSIGTLLIGAAPDAGRISRIVLMAPHTGYWRDYLRRGRWALFLTWHVLMPIMTKIVGYFPGRALGLGEDLPKGFALEWARRMQPELLVSANDKRRFGPILAQFDRIHSPTLALSIADDAFAPPEAGGRLLGCYPGISALHESISPADLGRRRLGHFGFLRPAAGEYFWKRISAWILQDIGDMATASKGVSSREVTIPTTMEVDPTSPAARSPASTRSIRP